MVSWLPRKIFSQQVPWIPDCFSFSFEWEPCDHLIFLRVTIWGWVSRGGPGQGRGPSCGT